MVWKALAASLLLAFVGADTFVYSLLKTAEPREINTEFLGRNEITLLAIGGQGLGHLEQWQVAKAMERHASREDVSAVLLLGNNFSRSGVESVQDSKWSWKFENVYQGALSHTPFFATLGNYDYRGNEVAQIRYDLSNGGSGRWQMPGRDYLHIFGGDAWQGLLRIAFIDTGLYSRNPQESVAQLDRLLKTAGPATWTLVVTHAPLVSGNEIAHIEGAPEQLWLPVFTKHRVDAVLSGHDRNMQVIELSGWPAAVIVGGGGKSSEKDFDEGTFGLRFSDFQIGYSTIKATPQTLSFELVNVQNKLLFELSLDRRP